MSEDKIKVTIYTLPSCVQCDQTKRLFKKNHIEFDTVDLSNDEEATRMVQGLGYQQAPIVIAGDKHWSGFRISKIEDLVVEIEARKKHN